MIVRFKNKFFVRFRTLSPTVASPFLVSSWLETGTGTRNWWVLATPSTGTLTFGHTIYPGPSYDETLTVSSLAMSANTTHAIAVERSGSNFYLYFDGVKVATDTFADSIQQGIANIMTIGGGRGTNNKRLDGYIGPIRICDEAIIGGASAYTVRTTPFATS